MKAKEYLINRFGKDTWDFESDKLQVQLRPSSLVVLMEEYAEQQINLSLGGVCDSLVKDIRKSSLLKEEQLEPIENALYATKHFTTSQSTELAEGILIYIQDNGYDIVKIIKSKSE